VQNGTNVVSASHREVAHHVPKSDTTMSTVSPQSGSENVVKVGLALVIGNHVLLVRRHGDPWLILPGGKPFDSETDEQALLRESREELSCDIDLSTLSWLGEFTDDRAGDDGSVTVRLYAGSLTGTPKPSAEIEQLVWHSLDDISETSLAPSLRKQILPRLSRAH
jgi:8-oxo-dGTP diphosphatase